MTDRLRFHVSQRLRALEPRLVALPLAAGTRRRAKQWRFVRDLFDAIDQGRWDHLPAFFTPDCCYERPGYDAICGVEALLTFYREVRVIRTGTHAIEDVVWSADTIVCWGRFTGVSRTDESLSERFADVYRLSGGRISRRSSFFFRPAI